MTSEIEERLAEIREAGLYRRMKVVSGSSQPNSINFFCAVFAPSPRLTAGAAAKPRQTSHRAADVQPKKGGCVQNLGRSNREADGTALS